MSKYSAYKQLSEALGSAQKAVDQLLSFEYPPYTSGDIYFNVPRTTWTWNVSSLCGSVYVAPPRPKCHHCKSCGKNIDAQYCDYCMRRVNQ